MYHTYFPMTSCLDTTDCMGSILDDTSIEGYCILCMSAVAEWPAFTVFRGPVESRVLGLDVFPQSATEACKHSQVESRGREH